MKPLKCSIDILFILLLFTACQDEYDLKPLPESGYPYTYKPLSDSELAGQNASFQQKNIHEGLNLNAYGFLKGSVQINKIDTITCEFVINKIDSLILVYREFMGIPKDVNFNYENQILVYVPYMIGGSGLIDIGNFKRDMERFGNEESFKHMIKNIKHKYYLVQNQLNGKYFSGIELTFNFNLESNFIEISGNWFPEALIPQEEIYSEEEIFMIARNEILKRTGRDIWETKYNYRTHPLLLKVNNDGLIEIRDCWCINTLEPPYIGYTIAIYIDTQTGEVVKYYDKL